MRNTEAALRFIVTLLRKYTIPFQIGGGFAARVYGSERELADIDIAMPEDRFDELLPEIREYVVSGPERYLDEQWDVQLLTLNYEGQEIELVGSMGKKFFNKQEGKWIDSPSDFSSSYFTTVYGIEVPIMAKDKLIAYKKMLGRDVDVADVKAIDL